MNSADSTQGSSPKQVNKIHGKINYPPGYPDQLPKRSCLVINLFDTSSTPAKFVNREVFEEPLKNGITEYVIKVSKEKFSKELLSKYEISAYVNIGWCSKNQESSESPKENTKEQDYVTETPHPIQSDSLAMINTGVVQGPDISLKSGKRINKVKYLCAKNFNSP